MSRDVYADIRNMTAEDRREIFEFAKKRAAEMSAEDPNDGKETNETD